MIKSQGSTWDLSTNCLRFWLGNNLSNHGYLPKCKVNGQAGNSNSHLFTPIEICISGKHSKAHYESGKKTVFIEVT